MQLGHRVAHPTAPVLPDRFDPSGVPTADAGHGRPRGASSHRRHPRSLPGLAPTAVIASVEEVTANAAGDRLLWGSVGGRPILFEVEAGVAAELVDSLARGEAATAIVEPWQLMLERLD